MTRTVTLFTRAGCGLCDETAALLRPLERELRFTLSERDVDADPALAARYGDAVPVVVCADIEVARAPIDAAALRAALAAALR